MKNVVYLAVEFTNELDIVDNLVKAAMEAEEAWLEKEAARRGEIQVGKKPEDCIQFDCEIGKSEDVSLVNLFPDEIPEEPVVELIQEAQDTAEIAVFTGDAEVATAELSVT